MKKLILLVYTLLLAATAVAQKEIKISGRLINERDTMIGIAVQYKRVVTFTEVPVSPSGAFTFTEEKDHKSVGQPVQAMLLHSTIEPLPLMLAPGYDLYIEADASDQQHFTTSLKITGKGAALNALWKDLFAYRLLERNKINWFTASEAKYVKHLKDSLASVSAVIKTLAAVDDPNSTIFQQLLLKQLNIKAARNLYRYAHAHHYNYTQTENLIRASGLPDTRKLATQHSGLADDDDWRPGYPEEFTTYTPQDWKKIISFRNDRFLITLPTDILGVRFGREISSDIYEGLSWTSGKLTHNSIVIDGKTSIDLAAMGVDEKNAAEFQYRIIQNDSRESVGWTTPSIFRTAADGHARYAFLGTYPYVPGQVLTAEIANRKNFKRKDAIMIDWRPVKKAAIDFTAEFTRKDFRNQVLTQNLSGPISEDTDDFVVSVAPDIRIRLGDSLKTLTFRIRNSTGTYAYIAVLKRPPGSVEKFSLLGSRYIGLGKVNSAMTLEKETWKYPGEYEITFTPVLFKHGGHPSKEFATLGETIRFTVLPPLDAPPIFSARTVIYISALIAFIAICIIAYFRLTHIYHEARVQREKEMATLQLRSVRSQLNPHFMFNALAGIQNLMNRKETDNANLYLTKFARLTRNVLDENDKDRISISAEMSLLEDYLQMEQMRFGFNYIFEVDEAIDKENTDIPSMLLQPFVENAIKHGISGLNDKGLIAVRFLRRGKNLVLQVHDNGKGYDYNNAGSGRGICLSKSRMDLYNRIYKETTISFNILADNGTLVIITLKNWIG